MNSPSPHQNYRKNSQNEKIFEGISEQIVGEMSTEMTKQIPNEVLKRLANLFQQ